jgi:hypothetical protein
MGWQADNMSEQNRSSPARGIMTFLLTLGCGGIAISFCVHN